MMPENVPRFNTAPIETEIGMGRFSGKVAAITGGASGVDGGHTAL
jgi:hypothetical protein